MTENKRFWLVSLKYGGEQRFVRDNNLIGEKSMSNQEVVDTLNKFQELSINDLKQIEQLKKENEQLKQELFETSRDLLWATSDEVDRVLYFEDEVEELRKEIFE